MKSLLCIKHYRTWIVEQKTIVCKPNIMITSVFLKVFEKQNTVYKFCVFIL